MRESSGGGAGNDVLGDQRCVCAVRFRHTDRRIDQTEQRPLELWFVLGRNLAAAISHEGWYMDQVHSSLHNRVLHFLHQIASLPYSLTTCLTAWKLNRALQWSTSTAWRLTPNTWCAGAPCAQAQRKAPVQTAAAARQHQIDQKENMGQLPVGPLLHPAGALLRHPVPPTQPTTHPAPLVTTWSPGTCPSIAPRRTQQWPACGSSPWV